MEWLTELVEFLKGKKSYITAITIVVLGTLQALELFVVPEVIWTVLAALGIAFIRAGVNKVSEAIKPPEQE